MQAGCGVPARGAAAFAPRRAAAGPDEFGGGVVQHAPAEQPLLEAPAAGEDGVFLSEGEGEVFAGAVEGAEVAVGGG